MDKSGINLVSVWTSKVVILSIHLHPMFMGIKYVVIWSPQYVYCVCNNCIFYKRIIPSIRIKTSLNSNLWKNSSRVLSPELWPLMRSLAETTSKSRQNIWFQLDFFKKKNSPCTGETGIHFALSIDFNWLQCCRRKKKYSARMAVNHFRLLGGLRRGSRLHSRDTVCYLFIFPLCFPSIRVYISHVYFKRDHQFSHAISNSILICKCKPLLTPNPDFI